MENGAKDKGFGGNRVEEAQPSPAVEALILHLEKYPIVKEKEKEEGWNPPNLNYSE